MSETIESARVRLRAMGIRKGFKPAIEDTGKITLKTRRPAQVIDGALFGSEIVLWADSMFLVWTAQKRKVKALAAQHGLKCRLWDDEAEVFVPAALADVVLPQLGAKVKADLSPEQREVLKLRLAKARNPSIYAFDPAKTGGSSDPNPKVGHCPIIAPQSLRTHDNSISREN